MLESFRRRFSWIVERGFKSVMFEEFAESAIRSITLARQEAQRFNHNRIGTEHLLLGLLREDGGTVAQVFASFNVSLDSARERVGGLVGSGEAEGVGDPDLPFTPRLKRVLQMARHESAQLRRGSVDTEHLLLGLLRESEGVAARVIRDLGVDPDGMRQETLRAFGVDEEDMFDKQERRVAQGDA